VRLPKAYVSVLFVVLACRDKVPAPLTTPDPVPHATASEEIPPVHPSVATETQPPAASASAVARPAAVLDVGAWLHARGAAPSSTLDSSSCYATHIGTIDALMCYGAPSETLPGGEAVFPLRVVTVSNRQTVTALVTPIAAGPLDREIDPSDLSRDLNYITLDATFDSAGTLTIGEKAGNGCAKVLAQYAAADLAPHRRVIQKACASRGKYELQNGKLARVP
jgi:hypothetical protein